MGNLDEEKTLENDDFFSEALSDKGSGSTGEDAGGENLDFEEDFKDPTAPEMAAVEKSDEKEGFFSEALSDKGSRGVHDPETVKKILEMESQGLSGRKIYEAIGTEDEEITKDDIFAVLRHYRAWTADSPEPLVRQPVGQNQSIEEVKKENKRIWKEKLELEQELERTAADRDALRKWVNQLQPEQQDRLDIAENRVVELTNENVALRDRLESEPSKLLHDTRDLATVYTRGRAAGREEMKLELEVGGTPWPSILLVPLTGIAGIVAGAVTTWLLS